MMKHTDEVLTGKEQRVIFKRLLSYAKVHYKKIDSRFSHYVYCGRCGIASADINRSVY